MRKDQARFSSPRQADCNSSANARIKDTASLNFEKCDTLRPLPQPHVIAGVPVRQSGLTENCMLKRKARLVVLIGLKRLDQTAVNTAQRIGLLRAPHGGKIGDDPA